MRGKGLLLVLLIWGGGCQRRLTGPMSLARLTADPNAVRVILPTQEATPEDNARVRERAEEWTVAHHLPLTCLVTDQAVRGEDLTGRHLVVFGTPQGNAWLATQGPDLLVTLGPDRLKTGRIHAGAHLGFLTLRPRPGGNDRWLLVVTAARAEDVGTYLGPVDADFLVTRGATVIERGQYVRRGSRLSFPVWNLSAREARRDLDVLFATIESVHPAPRRARLIRGTRLLHGITAARIDRLGAQGPVPRVALAKLLARACAAYEDSALFLELDPTWADTSDPTHCMLPFVVAQRAGALYVGEAIEPLRPLVGARILGVNGRPLETLLDPALQAAPGQRPERRLAYVIGQQRTVWALYHPTGEDLVDLSLADPNGAPRAYVVDLMSLADYDARFVPTRGAPFEKLRFYQDQRVAYWPFAEGPAPAQASRVAEILAALRRGGSTQWILDLRHRRQADPAEVAALLAGVLDRPHVLHARTETKVSRALRRQSDATYSKQERGTVVSRVFDPTAPAVVPDRFTGELFVLIGADTVGPLADLAAALKDYGRATLIGRETGDVRERFGRALRVSLPCSGFTVQVPTTTFSPPLPRADDARRGTVPDLEITPSQLAPYRSQADPLRAFVLATLAKRASGRPQSPGPP